MSARHQVSKLPLGQGIVSSGGEALAGARPVATRSEVRVPVIVVPFDQFGHRARRAARPLRVTDA